MEKKEYGFQSDVEFSEQFNTMLLHPFLATFDNERTRNEYRRQIRTVCAYFYRVRGSRFSFEQLDEEDAKNYFLSYLANECAKGNFSRDTFSLRLSCCKNFSLFLEKRLPFLIEDGMWNDIGVYKSPFVKIVFPAAGDLLDARRIVSEADIDKVLSLARDYDSQLFIFLILSFRMMLPQHIIRTLKKEQFSIFDDNGRHVGIIVLIQKGKQVYRRIPTDILEYIEDYLNNCGDGYIFLNKRNRPLSPANLSLMLKKFEDFTGCQVKPGQLRTRGIIDLVAHNPDSLDEIEEYTGLSKEMIKGYGKALDRIAGDCIADRSSYCILGKKEKEV